jgi:ferritin
MALEDERTLVGISENRHEAELALDELLSISTPKVEFASPLEAAKFVGDLERTTTDTIHRLHELARKRNDYALEVLLHCLITERVEEERWSDELTALMDQFSQHPGQVHVLDREWGQRIEHN